MKPGVNIIMRKKAATLLIIISMLTAMTTACSSSSPSASPTPEGMDHSMEDMANMSSPDNSPDQSTVNPTTTPEPVQPTPTSVAEATYHPTTPSSAPDKLKTTEGTTKTTNKPIPAKAGDLKALSWYYMKQGKGKVPNFPGETKSFTPAQKTVWVGTGKKVYLTFDNGGPMGDTKKLLKALKDNHVKATFFIAGYNLKTHAEFLKQLIADGHLVANHTMSHKDMNKLTDEQVTKEINDFESLYENITGEKMPKYFRFPYGAYSKHLLSLVGDLGYTSVFWSTAMKDWVPRKNGADDAYNDIMNNLHDGNVILMHQGSDDNIAALGRIIEGIKKAGYEFGLVSDF
jgi:peptidoglycan-N-acetylmuramic acid deacetylase